MNYYNEFDPFAAEWLRNLIAAGLIPEGHVDDRDIREVKPDDLHGYTQCHFFAGIGGWSYALRLAGWSTDVPVWTGSCPCQPFSSAGQRKGTSDERHLWPELLRLIRAGQPARVFGEQVASKDGRIWLSGVRNDLEALGYEFGAADLCAAGIGAPHIRQRLFWVANSQGPRHTAREHGISSCEEESERTRLFGISRYGGISNLANPERDGGRGNQSFGKPEGGTSDRGPCAGVEAVAQGHGLNSGLEGFPGHGNDGDQPGRFTEEPDGSITASGAWDQFTIAQCRDAKSRRIPLPESGVSPVAHGIPRSMGRGRSASERMGISAARTNRISRLKGYGNAIVPQLAAVFVRAFMDLGRGTNGQ